MARRSHLVLGRNNFRFFKISVLEQTTMNKTVAELMAIVDGVYNDAFETYRDLRQA